MGGCAVANSTHGTGGGFGSIWYFVTILFTNFMASKVYHYTMTAKIYSSNFGGGGGRQSEQTGRRAFGNPSHHIGDGIGLICNLMRIFIPEDSGVEVAKWGQCSGCSLRPQGFEA